MDIPKTPVNSVLSSQTPAGTSTRQPVSISDISALNLKPGKNYPALIIQSQQAQKQASVSASTSAETKSQPSELPILQKNEYLARINAKTILISSEKILDLGQKLFLALDPKASAEKPALLAQLVGQNTRTGAPAGNTITAPTNPSQPSINTGTGLAPNNPQAISQLLQALNLTLDKQIPIHDGFKYIEPLLSAKPATAQSQIEPALREVLRQNLLSSLTRSSEIINPRTMSVPTLSLDSAGTSLKTALLNSGLFLEQALTSKPEKLMAFKAMLETGQAQLAQTASNSPTNTDAVTRQNALSASLNKIQQTIELLMQSANISRQSVNTQGMASIGQAMNDTTASTQDLKASLLSVASAASRQLAKELSAEALKSLFMLPRTEEYALSTFAFPLLQANKLQSGKSLFEKQEFTTGQMLKLLAGMIHRMQFNQLHSLLQSSNATAGESPLQQSWFFELPVINPQQQIQTFNFRIDKEAQQSSQQAKENEKSIQWKLLLSFELDELGPIYIQVKLHESSISSTLWADHSDTLKLLRTEAQHLKTGLESIGLNVSDIRCEQGQPTQSQTKLDRHLVDTKA